MAVRPGGYEPPFCQYGGWTVAAVRKTNNFLCLMTRPFIRTQKRPHFAPRGKTQAFLMLTFSELVFTNVFGEHLKIHTVYKNFKMVVKELGFDNIRFHDLRHSYAVASIKSGNDIKTIQENLGHSTASFTLDVYGHVTDQMKRNSAARMEQFIRSVNQ